MTTHDSSQGERTYTIDAESATEMARLVNHDLLLTQSMGGLFSERADLSNIHDILDIACGPGGWVLEVARTYPEISVTGIDISQTMVEYARAYAKARGLANAHFRVMDALKPLDFPSASFDLVNARALVGFMYPQAWPVLLQETLRICRPGGIVRLTEGEMPITNSPAFEKLSGLLLQALHLAKRNFSPDGRHLGITPMLGRLLHDAGFQNIQKKVHFFDFSAGTPAHEGFYQDFMVAFQLLLPFLSKMELITKEEFDQVYQQMLAEMLSNDFLSIAFVLTVWGEKP